MKKKMFFALPTSERLEEAKKGVTNYIFVDEVSTKYQIHLGMGLSTIVKANFSKVDPLMARVCDKYL